MPTVSVTMTAYNAEAYLSEALQSVLEQSFVDFEFIVVDDGSTDSTWEILSKCTDSRLIAIHREHDYIDSLNCAQQLAQGKYIARMDADDLMHPQRLAIQVAKLDASPEIDICTSWIQGFNNDGECKDFTAELGFMDSPLYTLLKRNVLYHPTAMIRRSFWEKNKLAYRKSYVYAEDYKLWSECAALNASFYVLPQILHFYRSNDSQVSLTHRHEQSLAAHKVQQDIMNELARKSSSPQLIQTFFNTLKKLEEEELLTHQERITAALHLAHRIL